VKIPLVDVKAQYAPLIPELKECFAEVLDSGRFIFGPEVEAFEREAAAYLGVPHAIGVANGTDALVLSLEAMGIGRGDEVICPSFTFFATGEAIARIGATPVFADIDPATMNLDPKAVPDDIAGLVAVHYAGLPVDLTRLHRRPAVVIEDAAQALGARTPDGPVGNCAHSTMTCFSFHPVKSITTGEGGAVTTNDDELADRLRASPRTCRPVPARRAPLRRGPEGRISGVGPRGARRG
jgi:dTDP-4-amino-4,6-dideoxygalactose transaminase